MYKSSWTLYRYLDFKYLDRGLDSITSMLKSDKLFILYVY